MPESSESFVKVKAAGHIWERRSPRPEDESVLGHTHNRLNALPMGLHPVHLQQEFPRIANDLARLWAKQQA